MVGLKPEAIEIAFNGADGPAFDKTPDFIKSLPVWKAVDESTLIAYEMNGAPLPHFNGFPARLIVPGWTGTYWMKHLISDHRADQAAGRFLDEPGLPHSGRQVPGGGAFRLPGKRHLDADHRDGRQLADHQPHRRRQGEGRQRSPSAAWPGTAATASAASRSRPTAARPGRRRRSARISAATPSGRGVSSSTAKRGKNTVMVSATNKIGQTQTAALMFNPAGYHNNVMQRHHAERG